MVKNRKLILGAVAGLGLLVLLFVWRRPGTPVASGPARQQRAAPSEDQVPRIALGRVEESRPQQGVGQRDIIDFGRPPTPPPPPPPPPTVAAMPTPPPEPTPTPLPPLTVKYMGSLEAKQGIKVAFFLTDKREVLQGQVGDTVMNRFRVVKIGLESVDIQELGTSQVRRLPLRGN